MLTEPIALAYSALMLSRERAALLLREQGNACGAFGSPLYAELLGHAAADVEAGGVVFDLIAPHDVANARADALALRLMAAVHRLVLAGEVPALAAHYPSMGGDSPNAWPTFHDVLVQRRERLAPLIALPCQTNEVGRAAALAFGFFEVASAARLPLRLLEVGASAGLNLRWDQYRYGGGGATWGSIDSPVDLTGLWLDAPAVLPSAVGVADRRGCDPRPVDPTSPEGRLSLQAALWADQVDRFARLRGALDVAARVPATVDRESVQAWLPRRLAERAPGLATVVYHSIVQEYFSAEVRDGFHACLKEAGERATPEAPFFWLRLEPISDPELRYAVRLTSWPGDAKRVVAWSGPHGSDVRRADV